MRDDNLYVIGFKNQQGDVYGLVDNRSSIPMLPGRLEAKTLGWSTKYRTMLGTKQTSNAEAAHKLAGKHLAGLIVMVQMVQEDHLPAVAMIGIFL